MPGPHFDADGWDKKTYAPFCLGDMRGRPRDDETPPFHLMFYDWKWLFATYDADLDAEGFIDGCYMNGPNVEGLVRAVRFASGRYPDESGMITNSEGDTCIVQFGELDEAVHVAELAAEMIKDRQKLLAAIAIARDRGFED
jgi:hypothetical protein